MLFRSCGGECVILRLVARLRKKDCFDLWRRVDNHVVLTGLHFFTAIVTNMMF